MGLYFEKGLPAFAATTPLCFRSLNATVYQRKIDGNEAIVKKLTGIYSIQNERLRNVRVIKGNTSLENNNVHVNFGLGD